MLRFAPTLLAVSLPVAASAQVVTVDAADVGDGLTAYTLTLTSPDARQIGGLSLNITGDAINQLRPGTVDTVFSDNNNVLGILGDDPLQDSQFLFNSADLLITERGESGTSLNAAFAHNTQADYTSRAAVRVVVPTGDAFSYTGQVSFANTGGQTQDIAGTVPEPATATTLAALTLLTTRRRRA